MEYGSDYVQAPLNFKMMKENMKQTENPVLITAGSTYLDIDAYACAVAMAELLRLQGVRAFAYSQAPCNYSVCGSLTAKGQILRELPADVSEQEASYIIVDVSDPEFLKSSVPLERVVEVYDHHVGFEGYWRERIGDGAHIEFIGAAATLIRNIVLFSVLVLELVGPMLSKIALTKAGDIIPENKTSARGVIPSKHHGPHPKQQ
jgi:hypothetical protein